MLKKSDHVLAPPVRSAVPLDSVSGEDDQDTDLLRKMAEEAVNYIRTFDWCVEIHEIYFGDGVGGIVALFLFYVTIREFEKPEWLWVVVGDLPPSYMEFEAGHTPRAALLRYIEGVEEWLATPESERLSGDLIPIDVPPGSEFAEMLRSRMKTLRSLVLPHLQDS